MGEPNFVTVNPADLTFKFELRKNIPVAMQLTNTTSERVAFKVKTTSPKKYCVRPSSGIIEPNGFKEVQVIMQAQREAPISYSDCRDKFLVQCVKVGAGVSEVTSDLFDPAKGDGLRQTKLRVILIPPAKPPSPVPEGNESEPTSPGSAYPSSRMTDEKMSIKEQLNKRLESLSHPATKRGITKQAQVSRPGYSLFVVLFVALLAFFIGQLSHNIMPELVEKGYELLMRLHELKAKYV